MSIPAIVSTFALAFFYFWPSIPSGLALGLTPVVVILTTALSYIVGGALNPTLLQHASTMLDADENCRVHFRVAAIEGRLVR